MSYETFELIDRLRGAGRRAAMAALVRTMIAGIPVVRAGDFPEQRLLDALHAEIQPARRRCALLPVEVLHSGVSEWLRR